MTIKNTDKNVSAENHEDVVVNASFNNGILTLIRKNLYDESTSAQKNIEVDLSDHKLKLQVITQNELDALKISTDPDDIRDREAYIFLVPFNTDEEDVYKEYIWIEDDEDFEIIGSTRINLSNYIQKSNTSGVIKNNGDILPIDNTSGGTGSSTNLITSGAVNAGLNGKASSIHNHSSSNITDMAAITVTITYTDNTTETLKLFKQVNNS